jgi:hypothetical protein
LESVELFGAGTGNAARLPLGSLPSLLTPL